MNAETSLAASLRALALVTERLALRAETGGDAGEAEHGGRLSPIHLVERESAALAAVAREEYAARRERERFLDSSLLREPAWDMLLDLFIQKVAGRRVSSTSLCLGANVPYATGARYIERLEGEGLVLRFTPPDDKRLVLIDYTPDGFHRMRDYISQAVTRFRVPLPD